MIIIIIIYLHIYVLLSVGFNIYNFSNSMP